MSWLTKSGGVIKAEIIAMARYDHLRTFFIDSAVSNPIAAKNIATIGNSNNIPIGIVVISKKLMYSCADTITLKFTAPNETRNL